VLGFAVSYERYERRLRFMSFDEAIQLISRDEAFRATVYAMNTLLIHKGIYTQIEFEGLFIEWVKKEQSKKSRREKVTRREAALA
jgi:hypothetical protein